MTEHTTKTLEAVAAVASAMSAPGTPDTLKVTQRDDRLSVWIRNLSGPAVSVLLVGVIAVLTWGKRLGLWTAASEPERATSVGAIGVALTLILGIALWVTLVGRPSRMEITAGPASLKLEGSPTA